MDASFVNWNNSENHFLVNPRWPSEIQEFFKKGTQEIISENNIEASLFIPTSGTTAKDLRDTKIVWLKKESFLNAAKSVGAYFSFSSSDRVAVTLPSFHVGGLSQEARHHVWQQSLFYFSKTWNANLFFEFLKEHQITHTSLVPAQLFDLVQSNLKAPVHLKCIFIGGGVLGKELRERAKKLGWNLQITYGMTETAALMAASEGIGFKPLSHAQMSISEEGFLKIKSNSLFSGYLRKPQKESSRNLVLDQNVLSDGWFISEDLAEEQNLSLVSEFIILGRKSDYAKIGGEGVYLDRLQALLQDSWLESGLNSLGTGILRFVESDRLGAEIHLFSTLPEVELRQALNIFNQKVLPFERIRGFHQVQEIPLTPLGKVRYQEIK